MKTVPETNLETLSEPHFAHSQTVQRIAEVIDNYLAIEWKIRSRYEHELVADAFDLIAQKLRNAAKNLS